jgi:hypothetical protein
MIVARILRGLWRILERMPLHPLFIVADLVLLFASGNVSGIEASTMLETGGVLLLGTAVAIALLIPVLGGLNRAAIGVSVILILTIPLPTIVGPADSLDFRNRLTLLIGIPLVILGTMIVLRRVSARARVLTLVFNLIALVLLAQTVQQPLITAFALAGHRPSPERLFPDIPVAGTLKDGGPDVWNIVMDRYAGPETLRRVYGFDNEPFLQELEKRGFSVARTASANYQRTAPSLTSSLNLDYLTPFTPGGVLSYDELPLYRALHDSRASRFFAAEGYAVIHAGPWWEPTRHDDHETASLNYADQSELARVMLERSLLGYLAVTTGMEFANGRLTQCHRTRIQFDRLEATATSPERKFVFAHLLLPHPPYVLDADGNCKDAAAAGRLTRVENYVAQVRYANRRLLTLLDRILAGPRPAVIVLQADEGPWPAAFAGNEIGVGMDAADIAWSDLNPDQLREKMMILYALRFPDGPPVALSDHATPVNTYRLILNRYFGMTYPLLPDRSYLFKDRRHLYDFIDVTPALQ